MKETSATYQGPERRKRRRHAFLPLALGTSGGVVLAGLAFWFFAKQAERVVRGRADRLDETILDLVHKSESPAITTVMRAATYLGSHPGVGTVAGLTAFALVRKGRRHDAWTIAASTGGAMALNTVLKEIFRRDRPKEMARRIKLPSTHSFPSGHSLMAAATFPIVAHHLVESRSLSVQIGGQMIAWSIILTVGYSRIYFGVHFPSDVLAGFSGGLGWLGLTSLTHTINERERLVRRRKKTGLKP